MFLSSKYVGPYLSENKKLFCCWILRDFYCNKDLTFFFLLVKIFNTLKRSVVVALWFNSTESYPLSNQNVSKLYQRFFTRCLAVKAKIVFLHKTKTRHAFSNYKRNLNIISS